MRVACLFLAALVVLGCSARPPPLFSPPPEEPAAGTACADFVYYFGGQQIGWARSQIVRAESAGVRAVVNKTQCWLCAYGIGDPEMTQQWSEQWRAAGGADLK